MALDWVVGGALIFCSMGTVSRGKSQGGELSPTWNLFPPNLIIGKEENQWKRNFDFIRNAGNWKVTTIEDLTTYHKFGIDWKCFGIMPLKELSWMFLTTEICKQAIRINICCKMQQKTAIEKPTGQLAEAQPGRWLIQWSYYPARTCRYTST